MVSGEYPINIERWQQNPEYLGVRAMVKRQLFEDRLRDQTTQELIGQPIAGTAPNMIPAIEELLVDVRTIHQLRVMAEEADADIKSLVTTTLDALNDEDLLDLARTGDVDMGADDIAVLRALVVHITSLLSNNPFEDLSIGFAEPDRIYTVAKIVSDEESVSVPDVFESDELYRKVMRIAYAPSEYIARSLGALNHVTPEMIAQVSIELMRGATIGACDFDENDKAEFEIVLQDMCTRSEFVDEIIKLTGRMKYGFVGYLKQQLERFWGEGAYIGLPDELRQQMESFELPTVSLG